MSVFLNALASLEEPSSLTDGLTNSWFLKPLHQCLKTFIKCVKTFIKLGSLQALSAGPYKCTLSQNKVVFTSE